MATQDELELRIRQMHVALGDSATSDLSKLPMRAHVHEHGFQFEMDANAGTNPATLMTQAEAIVHNIARLKDHLKKWLVARGKMGEAKDVEAFVRSNPSVAIVHDLCNSIKHGGIDERAHPPKSGHLPKLSNVRMTMQLSTGTSPTGSAGMSFGPNGPVFYGDVQHVLAGTVYDEKTSQPIADFRTLCGEAIDLWQKEFEKAGVVPTT